MPPASADGAVSADASLASVSASSSVIDDKEQKSDISTSMPSISAFASVSVSASSSASVSTSSSVIDDKEQQSETSTSMPNGTSTSAPKGTRNDKTSNTTAKSTAKDTPPTPPTKTTKATRKKGRQPKRTRDERLAMNRITARERRRKKRVNITTLQTRVRDLGERNELLKRSNATIRQMIEALSASNATTVENQQESKSNNKTECGAASTTCIARVLGADTTTAGRIAAAADPSPALQPGPSALEGADTSTLIKIQQILRLQQHQQQQEAQRDKEAIDIALQARIAEAQVEAQRLHALRCLLGSNLNPEASGVVTATLQQLLLQQEGPTITVPNGPQQPVSGYTTDTTSPGRLSRADSSVSRAGTNSSSFSMPMPHIDVLPSGSASAAAATAAELLLQLQQQQRQHDAEVLAASALARYRGLKDGTLTSSTSSVAAPTSVSSSSQSSVVSTQGNRSTVANENTDSMPSSANSSQGDLLAQLLLLRQSQSQQPQHNQSW